MNFQRKNPYRNKFRIALGAAIFLFCWLFLSTIADKSPFKTLAAIPAFFLGSDTAEVDDEENMKEDIFESADKEENVNDQSKVDAGTDIEVPALKGVKGMVDIESDKLNLRSAPSINSKIILKLPDSSEVDILQYDNKVYFLDGKSGYWCKVRFLDMEGWAWGNFIKTLEE